MRKIMITAAAGAALAITPALAAKPASKPDHPQKPPHPAKCKINSVGYNASGNVLTITDWTQTKGADTTTDTSDDRYSGTLTVDVKKANHKAPKGTVEYTLTDVKASFDDADHNGTPDVPKAGDKVGVHGKLTKYKKKCPGADLAYTIKRVRFTTVTPTV
jgi:hypothetical protein